MLIISWSIFGADFLFRNLPQEKASKLIQHLHIVNYEPISAEMFGQTALICSDKPETDCFQRYDLVNSQKPILTIWSHHTYSISLSTWCLLSVRGCDYTVPWFCHFVLFNVARLFTCLTCHCRFKYLKTI